MANDIKLGENHAVDENIRPLKVNGVRTAIETAKSGSGAKINGDLEVTGTITGEMINGHTFNEQGALTTIDTASSLLIDTTRTLKLNANDDLRLQSAEGKFVYQNLATEFSVEDSAYAGTILGYTTVGIDATAALKSVTTSFVTTNSAHNVKFVAPPSGAVEIFVSIFDDCGSSGRPLYFGLSDNATYNTLGATHEHEAINTDETDEKYLEHRWVITGLTANTAYQYWLGAKSSHNFTHVLRWGSDAADLYAPFIMKATALPTAVADYAVYG